MTVVFPLSVLIGIVGSLLCLVTGFNLFTIEKNLIKKIFARLGATLLILLGFVIAFLAFGALFAVLIIFFFEIARIFGFDGISASYVWVVLFIWAILSFIATAILVVVAFIESQI